MHFNFIIIPAVIIMVAYYGGRYTRQGLHPWYANLKKPKWTPPGKLIGEIWLFIYITTALAVMWFWNVPVFSWKHYVVGAVLLANAYLNLTWTKIFFAEKDISKAYKQIKYLNGTSILAALLMGIATPISAFLMLPYIIWTGLAMRLTKEILLLNPEEIKNHASE